MAKALNQNFYSSTLYGSQNPSGTLTLRSTSAGTLGEVVVVGSSLDIKIGGYVGRFIHANNADRTYTLPDYDGTLLAGGIYTAANQIVYSTAANATTVLNPVNNAALISGNTGTPTWLTGSNGEFLQIVGGALVFGALPDNGSVAASGSANTLPIYAAAGNDLSPLSTTNDRVLLSPIGGISWGLITENYLAAAGLNPLTGGTSGQKLKSNGDGTFYWDDDTFIINAGTQYALPYYSAAGIDSTLSASAFVSVDEASQALLLADHGQLRLYEDNGANYVGLRAPVSVTSNVVFSLPGVDGLFGDVLTTDGSGNWQFSTLATGTVAFGSMNQIAYYAGAGTTVVGLVTTTDRVLTSPFGAPSWSLLTTNYLASAGITPLGDGTLGELLSSNGDGTFSWLTSPSLSEVKKQGNVLVDPGASTVTVLYDDPFTTAPKTLLAQWSLEEAMSPATLPVIGVAASSIDGFTLQFSTTTTQTYTLYWYASETGDAITQAPCVYLAGGIAGVTYQNAIQGFTFAVDTLFSSFGTLPAPIAYTMSSASATHGYVNCGETSGPVHVTTFSKVEYATNTVSAEAAFTFARSKGAGVGDKNYGYVCGGHDPANRTDIEKINHSLDTTSVVLSGLSSANTGGGSATSRTEGYLSLQTGDIDIFTYATETSAAGTSLPALAQVGCNDTVNGFGYFGTTADIYRYDFATDTTTVVSSPGNTWSSASNSMTHGYFTEGGGSTTAYRFSFATSVLSASGNISFSAEDVSISTFQSKGLI